MFTIIIKLRTFPGDAVVPDRLVAINHLFLLPGKKLRLIRLTEFLKGPYRKNHFQK